MRPSVKRRSESIEFEWVEAGDGHGDYLYRIVTRVKSYIGESSYQTAHVKGYIHGCSGRWNCVVFGEWTWVKGYSDPGRVKVFSTLALAKIWARQLVRAMRRRHSEAMDKHVRQSKLQKSVI